MGCGYKLLGMAVDMDTDAILDLNFMTCYSALYFLTHHVSMYSCPFERDGHFLGLFISSLHACISYLIRLSTMFQRILSRYIQVSRSTSQDPQGRPKMAAPSPYTSTNNPPIRDMDFFRARILRYRQGHSSRVGMSFKLLLVDTERLVSQVDYLEAKHAATSEQLRRTEAQLADSIGVVARLQERIFELESRDVRDGGRYEEGERMRRGVGEDSEDEFYREHGQGRNANSARRRAESRSRFGDRDCFDREGYARDARFPVRRTSFSRQRSEATTTNNGRVRFEDELEDRTRNPQSSVCRISFNHHHPYAANTSATMRNTERVRFEDDRENYTQDAQFPTQRPSFNHHHSTAATARGSNRVHFEDERHGHPPGQNLGQQRDYSGSSGTEHRNSQQARSSAGYHGQYIAPPHRSPTYRRDSRRFGGDEDEHWRGV